jgi:hypothetical protein
MSMLLTVWRKLGFLAPGAREERWLRREQRRLQLSLGDDWVQRRLS